MSNDFNIWLVENGLQEAFTTNAGDALYINLVKRFGVLKKSDNYNVQSFYLDDIAEFRTYDDKRLIADWSSLGSWKTYERSTRFSTNNVHMKIFLKNGQILNIQIFGTTQGKIVRASSDYVNLYNYAILLSQIVYNCANRIGY